MKRKHYKEILREKLIPFMQSMNYSLSFDNDLLEKDDRNSWVFKLVFQGQKKVEISNDDWRDYTEYFNYYMDSNLIFTINILKYEDTDEAYEWCVQKLKEDIQQ